MIYLEKSHLFEYIREEKVFQNYKHKILNNNHMNTYF